MSVDFDKMTVAQLRTTLRQAMKSDEVSDADVVALETYIDQRVQTDMMANVTAAVGTKQRADKLDLLARKQWPQLNDEDSELFKAVEKYAEDNGISLIGDDATPDSMLNAANAVGLSMGLLPAGYKPTAETRQSILDIKGPGYENAPDGDVEEKPKFNPEIAEQMFNLHGIKLDEGDSDNGED